MILLREKKKTPGADLGGGGGGGVADPICTFLKYPYLVTDPKKFSKDVFWRDFLVKTQFFWSKFSKKCLKTPFFGMFFKIMPAAQKI